jgi:hypothetical protein
MPTSEIYLGLDRVSSVNEIDCNPQSRDLVRTCEERTALEPMINISSFGLNFYLYYIVHVDRDSFTAPPAG